MKSTRAYRFIFAFLSLTLFIADGARAQGVAGSGYALSLGTGTTGVGVNTSGGYVTGEFTVEFWVKFRALTNVVGLVAGSQNFKLEYNPSQGLHMVLPNTQGGFITSAADAATTFQTNVWYQIACVVNTNSYALYQDGVQLVSSNFPSATPRLYGQGFSLTLGKSGTNAELQGEVDEFRIWKVARTGAEIAADKNRALRGDEPGLVTYYRFDEGSGERVWDSAPADGVGQTGSFGYGYVPSNITPFTSLPLAVDTWDVDSITGSSNQQLLGRANAWGINSSAWFEWGTTTNYGNVTPLQNIGSTYNEVHLNTTISNLVPGTTYHYRAVGSNSLGVAVSPEKTFVVPPSVLSVHTLGGLFITNSSARLGGTANPAGTNMSAWFEWGTTTNYGNVTAVQNLGNGKTKTDFNAIIGSVNTNTTYHFRAVASNAAGIFQGADRVFPLPPPILAINRETNVVLAWQITAPVFLLEQSTDLNSTNWTTVYGATVSNGFYEVTVKPENAAFYRLRQLVNGPITPIITWTNDSTLENAVVTVCPILDQSDNYGCVFSKILSADYTQRFYATGVVDPNRRPNDPAPAFHWQIFYPEATSDDKYAVAGITGYFSPILTIQPNALPNIAGPLSDPATQWRFNLTVTHQSSDPLSTATETTVIGFRVRYAGSSQTFNDVIDCQGINTTPTACSMQVARPATERN